MIILVSGATKTVNKYQGTSHVGRFLGPRNGNSVQVVADSGLPWAADNDAYAAWDEERFWVMLAKLAKVDLARFLWVAVPDVVANAQATLDNWHVWFPQIDALGLPAAFVGQDGLDEGDVPWDELSCFFLGGSTEWKLSVEAERMARQAKGRGKLVHMGRVNSRKRARHAHDIGCDSIDGRMFSAWPETRLPRGIVWCRDLVRQPSLFAGDTR